MKKKNKPVNPDNYLSVQNILKELPKTEIIGKNEIYIENFRGILDYDEQSFKINTRSGIIKIDGSDLALDFVTDEGVCLKGNIIRIEFI